MNSTVKSIKPRAEIHFADGRVYELPFVNVNCMTEDLKTFGMGLKLREKMYTSSANNIVGNVCGNTLSIDLKSVDKLLIPNNAESKYFGFMNDTAYVELYFYLPDEDTEVYMGRYYVDTWESEAQATRAREVNISCVDLMSKIKNMTLDKIRLHRNMNFNNFLKIIIKDLNSRLPEHMQILYKDDDLRIFRNSSYEWQMYFNNIERKTVEGLFNDIAKYTISYIWIDRNNYIKTDHLIDDDISESVGKISDKTNLIEYTNCSGDIDKYSGVRVKYIDSISYEDKELLNISNLQLYKGNNVIEDVKLSSDKVADINTWDFGADKGKAFCTKFNNYKDSIDMIIKSKSTCKINMRVYGKVINEVYGTVEKRNNNNGNILEIENRVLIKQLIHTYANGLNNLMSMKNNKIQANGFISPLIECGNTLEFEGTRLDITDFYKVVGMEFIYNGKYRCNVDLLKTIQTTTDVDDILYDYNSLLYRRLCGDYVDASEYRPLTEADNEIAYNRYKEEIDELSRLTGVAL